jgi:phosphoserine phosphatase
VTDRGNHLAVVFDFDDTLLPDATTQFLASRGYDVDRFWGERTRALVESGYDAPLAYLQLLLDDVRDGPLAGLTNRDLHAFGATLDATYFTGLPALFSDLRDLVRGFRDLHLEFFIVSSGILPIIEGSRVVQEHIEAVYACELAGDADDVVHHIRRCVTFTEKTRYLFEINKGIPRTESARNPGLVNRRVERRRIPFRNMIYVGDGLTDIPCFSLLRQQGGTAFGVFDPAEPGKAKRALQEFLRADRTTSSHAPRYGPTDELGSLLRAAVETLCNELILARSQAWSV